MSWALYLQSIRNRRLSWLVYSAIGLVFSLLYLGTFPAVQSQAANYNEILKSLPKGVLEAFNITQSSPTLMAYLAAKHFGLIWPLMIILLMTSFAGGALAREVDNRTMGFMLSLPISRLKFYIVRVMTGITGLVLFIALSELTVWPLAKAFGYTAPWSQVFNIGILGFLFGMAVLGIGILFSTASSSSGRVNASVSAVLLMMYVMNIIALLENKVDKLKYLSLFHYFNPGALSGGSSIGVNTIIVLSLVSFAALLTGALIFTQRDISV